MTERLFIFGLGYSGLEIARLAKAAGWSVAGTCTSDEKAAGLRADGIEAHRFDGTAALPAQAMDGATHVLCTIAPGTAGDPALRTCSKLLQRARWFGYLSTTGVYGDHGGGWVDEETPPKPLRPRSLARLAAERAWQALGLEAGVAVDVFRLPGIYGPGRSAVDQVKAGTARRIDKPGQVFSRIHVEDIATALAASMARPHPGTAYNLCDDAPAAPQTVIAFACELLGVVPPPLVAFDAAELSPMARSFYDDNKCVSNALIKRELGVSLRYPNYRAGLAAILAAERVRRGAGG